MRMRMVFCGAMAVLAIAPAAAAAQSSGTIAYWAEGADYLGVSTIPAAGGTATPLAGSGEQPAISPDGSQVAYIGGFNLNNPEVATLFTVSTSGGTPSMVTGAQTTGPPAWSKNGSQLTYTMGGVIYTVSASGGTAKKVFDPPNGSAVSPAFAPNGKTIYFMYVPLAKTPPPYGTPGTVYVASVGTNGSGFKQLSVKVPSGWYLQADALAMSPSGRTLALNVQKPQTPPPTPPNIGAPTYGIATVPTSGGTATVIAQGYSAPSFSPSGTQLCANTAPSLGGPPPTLTILTTGGGVVSSLGVTGTDCSWAG